MKDIIPPPPSIVRNRQAAVQQLFRQHVIPSYGRFELALSHGSGSWVWDVNGRRFLDLGGGIAVCCLGHANPEIADALSEQARRLIHISNLYYHEPQGRLAQQLCALIGPGRIFFCNSGAEANEGLYKLARKFGHPEGRFEILTALNSFHGRTLGGISATGQEKVKQGFGPMVSGFRHIPYNDLEAARNAISPATAAILIEGVQGEGGVNPATAEYLLGLRRLCDEHKLLLLLDGVQCGHFRTGRFQSFQRVLENHPESHTFRPDGIAMAKSLGGGFPMGAFWVHEPLADLLSPGTHGTTFGGNLLGCAVALRILEVIEREKLAENARRTGELLRNGLQTLVDRYPSVLKNIRGLGLLIGLELQPAKAVPAFAHSDRPASTQFVNRLHDAGLLAIPAGSNVIRILPPLNLRPDEAEQGLEIIGATVASLA